MKSKELTEKIIGCYYKVYNTLGYGFLEKIYENAMIIELKKAGLSCEKQKEINVFYEGENVGLYFTDILVNNEVIIELKAAEGIIEEHECQLVNYLKATEAEVGLLFNLGKEPEFKRKIFTNDRKKLLQKT